MICNIFFFSESVENSPIYRERDRDGGLSWYTHGYVRYTHVVSSTKFSGNVI